MHVYRRRADLEDGTHLGLHRVRRADGDPQDQNLARARTGNGCRNLKVGDLDRRVEVPLRVLRRCLPGENRDRIAYELSVVERARRQPDPGYGKPAGRIHAKANTHGGESGALAYREPHGDMLRPHAHRPGGRIHQMLRTILVVGEKAQIHPGRRRCGHFAARDIADVVVVQRCRMGGGFIENA
ncbi:MAG: hypothetical protein IT530_09000 [Burkholderiales bacterium]|nr:hypothetical protein [Burkholderiales bacterium]